MYLANNKLSSLPDSIGNLKACAPAYATWLFCFLKQSREGSHCVPLPQELTILSVSDNALKELPTSIGGLTSLTSLNVSKNKLNELPLTLGKLASLVQLIAGNNRITSLPEYGLPFSIFSLRLNGQHTR